jgi:hypothetical protein
MIQPVSRVDEVSWEYGLRELRDCVSGVSRLGAEFIDVIYAASQAVQAVLEACPRCLGRPMVAILEALPSGEELPDAAPQLLRDLAPRVMQLPFAAWAILDPLIRTWRSQDGCIVALIPVNAKNKLTSEPEIISRGFVPFHTSTDLWQAARKEIQQPFKQGRGVAQDSIRETLQNFFNRETRSRPVVLLSIIQYKGVIHLADQAQLEVECTTKQRCSALVYLTPAAFEVAALDQPLPLLCLAPEVYLFQPWARNHQLPYTRTCLLSL